ncbi:MAG: hypothetical protein ACYCQI_17185 [Gammaproteobacteria bacterium]
MFSFFKYLNRGKESRNSESKGRVEIFHWHHKIYNPAGHIALKIVKEDKEYYLSLNSKMPGKKGSLWHKRNGVDSFFTNNLDEDCLIQGFRHACPEIFNYINENKVLGYELNEKKLKSMSEFQILELVRKLPLEKQNELKSNSKLDTFYLKSLDVDTMIEKINELRSVSGMKWALVSGTHYHREHTYNCASLSLQILYAGKLDKLVSSVNQDIFSMSGLALGIALAYLGNASLLQTLIYVILGSVSGKAFYDCIEGSQSYIKIQSDQGRDSSLMTAGIYAATATLSFIFGSFITKPSIPAMWTCPGHVLNMVKEAQTYEKILLTQQSFSSYLPEPMLKPG